MSARSLRSRIRSSAAAASAALSLLRRELRLQGGVQLLAGACAVLVGSGDGCARFVRCGLGRGTLARCRGLGVLHRGVRGRELHLELGRPRLALGVLVVELASESLRVGELRLHVPQALPMSFERQLPRRELALVFCGVAFDASNVASSTAACISVVAVATSLRS